MTTIIRAKQLLIFLAGLALFMSCSVENKLDLSKGWRMSPSDAEAFREPGFDDSSWPATDLPSILSHKKSRQVFWLRKSFIIPEKYRGRSMALTLGRIHGVDKVWFNGALIGSSGSETPRFIPAWHERSYFIPAADFRTGGRNVIALRIVTDSIPVFSGRPFVSDTETARIYNFYKRFKSEGIVISLTMLALFLGIISFVQYLSYRRYKTPLYYSIVAVVVGIISLYYYIPVLPDENYYIRENIFYALMSVELAISYFLVEYLLGMKSRVLRIYIIFTLSVCVLLALTATREDPVHGWRINVMSGIGLVSCVIWGIMISRSLRTRITREAVILTAGFLLYLGSMIFDSLVATGFLASGIYLLPAGSLFLLISLGIVLSLRTSAVMRSDELKKYLPPQLVDAIVSGKRSVRYENERRKLTIFFSDIKDFTETTDSMEAEELTGLLNEYLTEMTGIANRFGGTVDKFIGDAIMIFFGAPEATTERDHALRCVNMAVEMQKRMRELQKKWFDEGIEFPLAIRIGINTGTAAVGNFGAEYRLSYTVIGGHVNLAARLESICEPGGILISHTTWALVKDEIRCRRLPKVRVKGIHREIIVYEVLGQ